MNIIVKSGVAIIGGSVVSLASDTTVAISTPDPNYPRFDLITLKSTGAVGYYTGTPEAAVAVDTAKPETYVKPKPPSTPAGEVALAEVFVPAGATAIDKIIDRRIITGIHASQITSGRFPLSRMPDGPSGYVLTAKGPGVDPSFDAPSVDAGALEDSYITLFKSRDPRSARIFEFSELLYNAGKLTADDAAGFINDVLCFSPEWIAKLATNFESYFSVPFVASVLNATTITASNAASIIDNANLSVSRVALIFNNANLTASKAASIFNNANLSISKVASICDSANITSVKLKAILDTGVLTVADKLATILDGDSLTPADAAAHIQSAVYTDSFYASAFNSTYLSLSKAVSIFNDANLSASRAASILNDANLSVSRAASILNDANLSVSKVAAILGDTNLSASRAVAILGDVNLSADRAQAILYSMADQGFYDKVLAIIVVGASNYSVTANTTLTTGVNRYGTLSISSGVTLTLGAGPGVILADTISNSGTIASGWVKGSGGAAGASGAGAGGNGAGAVILLARSITIGTVRANGGAGGNGSTVATSGAGTSGAGGLFWTVGTDTPPNGGSGPSGISGSGAGRPNGGGGGGAASSSYIAGSGGSATVTSFSDAPSLLKELLKSACDWWLVNVAGKSPSSTKSIPNLGGSGGGGGAAYDTYGAGGGGGGGGGEIIVYGTSVTAGSLFAVGGAGGSGGTEGPYDGGGGGGGGGIIYVLYKSLTGTDTFSVGGGAGGGGDGAGTAGGTGIGREIAV